jgi:hypothetical protein
LERLPFSRELDAGEVGYLTLPGGDVSAFELIEVPVAARTGQHLHQLVARCVGRKSY